MQRREFIKLSTLAMGATLAFNEVLTAQDKPMEIETGVLKIDPVLISPETDTMTVVWMTESASSGWVEYGIDGKLDQKAFSSSDGLVDANKSLHSVILKNLKPGTKYSYRVVTKEIQKFEPYKVTFGKTIITKENQFTTLSPDKKKYSFVMLNDLHGRWNLIDHNLNFVKDINYDFVVFNGDIIQDPQSDVAVIGFLQACSSFAGSIPIVYARGNHETRGGYARNIKDYLRPEGKYYYSFTHGPASFLVMDGGEDKADDHWAYSGLVDFDNYRTEQMYWLTSEVKKTEVKDAKVKIFVSHIPLYANGDANTCKDGVVKWGTMLDDLGIDLYLAGHTHRPDYVEANSVGNAAPVAIGGAPSMERCTVTVVDVSETKLNVKIILAGAEMVSKEIKIN
ncbi:MAG: metallophosphoesterase [Phycisphaerae bacterium]|nr:metallophosphoesterase [Phycisphaerae bacterium]